MTENIIQSVIVNTAGNDIQINLSAIIDCSGESSVSQLTGLSTINSEKYQAAEQVCTSKNVTAESESNLVMR